ncbi:MAG TPA: class I SAM-dependent methyltransferase [Alphaproteobacteria bacterium]|nr:class I SAM-dependent methyltransferase [Alphaproteobacteria bacterium]
MQVKELIKEAMPRPVFYGLKRHVTLLQAREAEAAFRQSGRTPDYLDDDTMEALSARFTTPPVMGYGPEETAERGRKKAQLVRKLVKSSRPVTSLELACWDGMVPAVLAHGGWKSYGIDVRSAGFDARAEREGAVLRQMDASKLDFADDMFDVVYSFDAFEHFPDPAAVLSEAIRVTRNGGLIFVDFGPLYNAPYGLHAYLSMPVPYCQFLFRPEQLNAFTERHGRDAINFEQCNGWSIAQFRALWARHRDRLVPRWYFENYTSTGLALVATYPSCFRSKVNDFDELLVNSIHALFEVRK